MKFSELKEGEAYDFFESDGVTEDGEPRVRKVRAKVLKVYDRSVLTEVQTKGGRRFKKGFNRMDDLNFEIEKITAPMQRKQDSERKRKRRECGATLEDLYLFIPGSERREISGVIDMFRDVESECANRAQVILYDTSMRKFKRFKEEHGDEFRQMLELERCMREIAKGERK